jgi:heme exporter protein D
MDKNGTVMDSLGAFLNMDGYGGFVWPAFAVTVLVMAALLVASLCSLKSRESTLAALRAAGGLRANAGEANDET